MNRGIQEEEGKGDTKELSLVKIYFKLVKDVEFGKAVYIVGNLGVLGYWKVENGVRMKYGENGNWRAVVELDAAEKVEYKFVIADFQNPNFGKILWENGANRVIDYTVGLQKELFVHQKWDYQKIIFKVQPRIDQTDGELFIIGNCIQLGLWISPLQLQKSPSISLHSFQTSIQIQKYRETINYCIIYKSATKLLLSKLISKNLLFAQHQSNGYITFSQTISQFEQKKISSKILRKKMPYKNAILL